MKTIGLLAACAVAALAADESTLIRNADVYPVTAAPIKNASVLIQNGKIADIAARIVPPKGVRVVEAKGLRVYPGMVDSATELGLAEIGSVRETVDTGEIGEFMPQLHALVAINPESEHFPVVRVNGITSVMTFPSSGGGGGGGGRFGGGERQLISGQAALIHTDGWTWEDMEINRSAAVHLIFPAIAGRGGRGGGPVPDNLAELFGLAATSSYTQARRAYEQQIAKLNEFFEAARRYQKARDAHAPDFRRDLKMEAMMPVLERKLPVAISAARASAIHDAIAFAEKQNVKIVILQPRELGKVAAELKSRDIPLILGEVLALPQTEDSPYDEAFSLPAEAYKAGVKFAFGTFNNQFVRNLPYQAATAVAFGLPYEEALKAVTINAAEIWGESGKIGSLEKGKVADLIVTDGDLLEIQTQVKHLYVKGREVPLTNKQTRLYEKYLARP